MPARLEAEGLGVAGSRWTYAIGRLVLWSLKPGLVDPQGSVLRSGQFKRLALADPKLAPYGAAALQTLQHLGLLQSLEGKLVQGDSIAQTYQFVATGNAELGFLALSQLVLDARLRAGSFWQVPAHMHAPLRQDALLLVKGRQQPAALALLAYLRSEAARSIISRHGYTV
jgi:molybdate transport system substrate-binding protein